MPILLIILVFYFLIIRPQQRRQRQLQDTIANLKIGDRIVTSGEGGVFPPGLPVGLVASLEHGAARVEPFVDLSQLGHVLVVDYGLSGGLPQPVPMAAHSGRRGKQARADESGAR